MAKELAESAALSSLASYSAARCTAQLLSRHPAFAFAAASPHSTLPSSTGDEVEEPIRASQQVRLWRMARRRLARRSQHAVGGEEAAQPGRVASHRSGLLAGCCGPCGTATWAGLSSRVTESPEESVMGLVIFSLLGVAEMSAMTSGVECTSP